MPTIELHELTKIARYGNIGGANVTTLDASGEWLAGVVIPDRTGNIDRIRFRTSTVASPPTYVIGVEAGSQVSTGTWLGATSNAAQTFVPNNSAFQTVTLAEVAPVTIGVPVLVAIRYSSGTIGASNRGSWNHYLSASNWNRPNAPYNQGSDTRANAVPLFSVGYDTGASDWNDGGAAGTSTGLSWSNASSPKFRGSRFVATCTFRSRMVCGAFRAGAGADFNLLIVKNGASSADYTLAVDADSMNQFSSGGHDIVIDEYTFDEGDTYDIMIEPTTATVINSLPQIICDDATQRALLSGSYHYVSATALGTNTVDATRFVPLFPIVSGADYVSGGAGRIGFGAAA